MAWTLIAFTIPQYENYPNYWMKAYDQGTTTPVTGGMGLDDAGAVTVTKLELNAAGFPVTTGSALVIPYINVAYDLWLHPTEALADANDTTGAIQIADNITGVSVAATSAAITAALSVAIIDELTTATMAANTNRTYAVGNVVKTKEFATDYGEDGGGIYDVVLASSVTPNAQNIIVGTADATLAFVLRVDRNVNLLQFGCRADGIELLDANISSSGTTLTATSASFVAADVGKGIAIYDAGATTTSLITTIASVTNGTTIEVADAAGTTKSNVTAQYGTDNSTAYQAVVDFIDTAGGGEITAKGPFYLATDIHLRADNTVYQFAGARFFKANTVVSDLRDLTRIIVNVEGYGGSFEPIGDSITAGSVNYNALVAVACHHFVWTAPKAKCRGGTRMFGAQTDQTFGVTPFQNLNDIQYIGVSGIGDGTTVDFIDITSGGGTEMVKNVTITGYGEGMLNGVNCASGTTGQTQSGINLDLTIVGAATMGCKIDRVKDSYCKVNVIGATVSGFTCTDPEDSEFDLHINGTGVTLGTAVNFASSIDAASKTSIHVTYDGTNNWATGLKSACQDMQYPSIYIDGADDGIDPSGFRSVFGSVVLRNCTVPVVDVNFAADMFTVPVVNLGTGANPQYILDSTNRFKTEDVGDTSITYTVGEGTNIRSVTTLTADRTVTLSTTGAYDGAVCRVSRPSLGGFNLTVNGFNSKALASLEWCEFIYNTNSGGWVLWSFGSL